VRPMLCRFRIAKARTEPRVGGLARLPPFIGEAGANGKYPPYEHTDRPPRPQRPKSAIEECHAATELAIAASGPGSVVALRSRPGDPQLQEDLGSPTSPSLCSIRL
jgi:hypothetical protein